MYINYDFQVKLPTNALFKSLTVQDFSEFYKNSIASRIINAKKLLAIWIKTSEVKSIKKKYTFINFLDDSEEAEPIVRLNAFECKDVEQLKQKYDIEEIYQQVLRKISREWQDFLINKFGVEYKTLLVEHETKRLENLSSSPDVDSEQLDAEYNDFNTRFGDIIGKQA